MEIIMDLRTTITKVLLGEDKMDNEIIRHATTGMKPHHIAKKLNIPAEWVHQTLKHHKSADDGYDPNDARNRTQGRNKMGD